MGCGRGTPKTTLHQAVEKGDIQIVQRHIAIKTDLNKKNSAGWTALHLAIMKGDMTIIQALVEAGADVALKGKDDKTAMDLAQEKNQAEVVKYLQEHQQSQAAKPSGGGRGLIDGGLGVSGAMDAM